MMKRIVAWLSLLALLLGGCAVTVAPSGGVCRVWDRSLTSLYSVDAQPVICSDRLTRLEVGFSHNAWLEHTRLALTRQGGERYLSPRLPPQHLLGRERYEVLIPGGSVPLSAQVRRAYKPQAVIAVPGAAIIGYTDVELQAYDTSGYMQTYRLGTLPVIACGD